MSGEVWDLAVVGAGPAGAATALAALQARPGCRVLLLDRADLPRDKSCGDGIAPHALDVLSGLGAGDLVDDWAPVRRLELSRGDRGVAGEMARAAYVVPRQVFDARVAERAVAAGAVLRRHRLRVLSHDGEHHVLDGTTRARVVVGADGAHSAVRRCLGHRPGPGRALAIRGYAPTPARWSGRQVIRFGERRDPSYAWAFDRGDGLCNVGYGELVRSSGELSRDRLLARLEELLPGAAETGTAWRGHHLPLAGWRWGGEQPDGAVLLVGDAAGVVNPMTGEGIYQAVETGRLAGVAAARSLADGTPRSAGARYRRDVRRVLGSHRRHTWLAARLSRHPVVLSAGLGAATAHRRVFDDLVELGLGDGRITGSLARGLATHLTPIPLGGR